jgi:hypothetical protein
MLDVRIVISSEEVLMEQMGYNLLVCLHKPG